MNRTGLEQAYLARLCGRQKRWPRLITATYRIPRVSGDPGRAGSLGSSCRPGKSFLEHLHDRELMSIEFLEDLVQPSGQFSLFPQQPHDRFHAFVMLPYRSRRHVWVVRRGQHDTGVFCEGLYGSTLARLEPEAFHDSIQVYPNLAAILLHRREDTLQLPVEL